MVLQVTNKTYTTQYGNLDNVLNNCFMIFYVVELALKASLWREHFLFGDIYRVVWNWMDFLIVFSGLIDLWICPLLVAAGLLQNPGLVRWLRYLRVGRLLRILKLVHTFLESDLS